MADGPMSVGNKGYEMDEPGIESDYLALLQSARVSARTREVILDRAAAQHCRSALTRDEL